MYEEIKHCRVCGNFDLTSIIDLGVQTLTGVFPKNRNEKITSGPLELVKCMETDSTCCGLVQLRHSYPLGEMYGENYGYRSGLNLSMVAHLQARVRHVLSLVTPEKGDIILDIGSNDCTTLRQYPEAGYQLVGMDPTGTKFSKYYPTHVELIPDFFSASKYQEHMGSKKAKIITSIAMFYDLESPLDFMRDIHSILADDGVWVFEQSYLPSMLQVNAYDTICHEHLEYYALSQIKWMAEKTGFKLIDVELNEANGGSFAVAVAKTSSQHTPQSN